MGANGPIRARACGGQRQMPSRDAGSRGAATGVELEMQPPGSSSRAGWSQSTVSKAFSSTLVPAGKGRGLVVATANAAGGGDADSRQPRKLRLAISARSGEERERPEPCDGDRERSRLDVSDPEDPPEWRTAAASWIPTIVWRYVDPRSALACPRRARFGDRESTAGVRRIRA